jgi:hypothetical protein
MRSIASTAGLALALAASAQAAPPQPDFAPITGAWRPARAEATTDATADAAARPRPPEYVMRAQRAADGSLRLVCETHPGGHAPGAREHARGPAQEH